MQVLHKKNLFQILSNQTKIRLYLPFSDWFGPKQTSVWFQINQKMVNKIWFQFDFIIFRKDFSVCRWKYPDRPVQVSHVFLQQVRGACSLNTRTKWGTHALWTPEHTLMENFVWSKFGPTFTAYFSQQKKSLLSECRISVDPMILLKHVWWKHVCWIKHVVCSTSGVTAWGFLRTMH